MLVCCLKSNHISNVKKCLFKSVLDLRDLYSFRSSSAPDCWCKWHNSSLWKLRDPKRIWKEVINSVSLFVSAALMFTDLRLLFQVSDKSRVEELSEFVVLVLQPGQLLLSLQQRVLQLREGEEQVTLQNWLTAEPLSSSWTRFWLLFSPVCFSAGEVTAAPSRSVQQVESCRKHTETLTERETGYCYF